MKLTKTQTTHFNCC